MAFLFAALTVATFTRLIVHDTLLAPLRRRWTTAAPSWVVKLLSCPWCISAWLSAAVTVPLAVMGLAPLPVLFWAGAWQAGKMLFWATEMMSRFGVDAPIEFTEVDDDA